MVAFEDRSRGVRFGRFAATDNDSPCRPPCVFEAASSRQAQGLNEVIAGEFFLAHGVVEHSRMRSNSQVLALKS
jgi:hypothetical protein